jgi:hypothetical protein
MQFKDTVYTQTGIAKGHTDGTCGEGEIRKTWSLPRICCLYPPYPWEYTAVISKLHPCASRAHLTCLKNYCKKCQVLKSSSQDFAEKGDRNFESHSSGLTFFQFSDWRPKIWKGLLLTLCTFVICHLFLRIIRVSTAWPYYNIMWLIAIELHRSLPEISRSLTQNHFFTKKSTKMEL